MTDTAEQRQRQVQRDVAKDSADAVGDGDGDGAIQAGARHYPAPPFPEQHQKKPGSEADLDPAPMWQAPYYKGSGKLQGKVALVTGGDSGIGRAVAVLFAREGADVAFSHLGEEEEDARVTQEAVEAEGRQCLVLTGDVADRDTCRQHAEAVVQMFGQIDILVNNAAFQVHRTDFAELSPEHFELTLKTNLFGYFYMAQAVLPHMPRGGAIVNTGSVTGLQGSKELVDYSMTKGGIHAFTRSLSGNLLGRGIRVNAVAPGPVWTPLNPSDRSAGEVAHFGAKSKMKRPAQPEELAPAYVFLASSHCSSYITGEILPVIGGY
ncbi:SDR family oxidoreductase [Frigidibacter sp. SD6-1]|uniref:SDR family oxidoreductase n=1 Tax=Frigidibacter sp. SD6-1 TaxID=3032581 RepID=UPI0024DFF23E|nr:SDR family oxidoreductase [Frigidibacter sp. SD6-1]